MHGWFAVPNWFDFQVLSSQFKLSSSRSNEPLPNALFDMIRLLVARASTLIPTSPLLLASLDWIVVFSANSNWMPYTSFWEELVARMVLPSEKRTWIPTADWLTLVLRSIVLLLPAITMPNEALRSRKLEVTTLLGALTPIRIPVSFSSICKWSSLLKTAPTSRVTP